MKIGAVLVTSLLANSVAFAIEINALPTLTVDSISLTNVLDQPVRLNVRGAGCPSVMVELKKDENRLLTCSGATSFTLEYGVVDGAGTRKQKVIAVPAGAHYTSGGVDWTDRTVKFVDIRSR